MRKIETSAVDGSNFPFWLKIDGPINSADSAFRRSLYLNHGVKQVNEAFPGSGKNEWVCLMEEGVVVSLNNIGQAAANAGFELVQTKARVTS